MTAVLTSDGDRPTIRLRRNFSLSQSELWDLLTERAGLSTWFPCDVGLESGAWQKGEQITFSFPAAVIDMTLFGVVIEVDVPGRLSYSWGDELLTFDLTSTPTGSILVLSNQLDAPFAARNAAGWETCLDRLEGKPIEDGAWRRRFDAYVSEFTPVLGHQDGPPAEMNAGKS